MSAINHQFKTDIDNPTIGLLICRDKDNVVAKYALESYKEPMGISEYQLSELFPKNFKSSMPTIEELEKDWVINSNHYLRIMDYLSKLNTRQREAVTSTEGRIRVVAGAGTGKTKALTCRYAYLVNEIGIDPANILCLTFTNKAAAEMRQRISAMVQSGDYNDFVCTIDGFASSFCAARFTVSASRRISGFWMRMMRNLWRRSAWTS